jgi:hypothetical protein
MAILVLDPYKLPKQQAIRVRYGVTNAVLPKYKFASHDYHEFPHDSIHCKIPDHIVGNIIGLTLGQNPADIRAVSHRYFPEIFTHTKFVQYGPLRAILFAQVGILLKTADGTFVPVYQIPMADVINTIKAARVRWKRPGLPKLRRRRRMSSLISNATPSPKTR